MDRWTTRLNVLAANVGAHQTGQSSLDYRLRDASHIGQQAIKLIKDLRQTIEETEALLEEGGVSEDQTPTDLGEDKDSITEIQKLHKEIANIITFLFQMSMLIRNPARHDFLSDPYENDTSFFESFDRDHVGNKFTLADATLVHRLGLAITHRWRYLNYRERHHFKLASGMSLIQEDTEEERLSNALSVTISTDFRLAEKAAAETSSISGLSLTSFAPSMIGGDAVTIPSRPKESADEKPFECPYCFFVITIRGKRTRARHVIKECLYHQSLPHAKTNVW